MRKWWWGQENSKMNHLSKMCFYAPLHVLLFHLNISSVSILVSIFEHCRLMVWKVGKTSVDRELLFEKDLHKYVMSKNGNRTKDIYKGKLI